MKHEAIEWHILEALIEEIILMHQKDLLRLGRRFIPTLTTEDLLQPNDYSELNNHPEFRYEEGVLAGLQTLHMALKALKNDRVCTELNDLS